MKKQSPQRESLTTHANHNSIYSTSYNKHEDHLQNSADLSKWDKSNQSKIKHGDYFVGTSYGEQPNQHNVDSVNPQSFTHREDLNFIASNKYYD